MFKINKVFILMVFILFIGVALRAQELISHNFLFLLDQGRDMMVVKGILYDHHLTLIGPSTSLRGVFQGPLWYYLLALVTAIFGGDPWGGIVLMFAISISVLLVVYFWMRELFGEKVALISLFLFSISPEAIAAATYAWNPHPMWLLIVVYIFSFYSVIYKSKKFNIILWPIIGLMFHFQTALAVFILLASIIYILIFQRKIMFSGYFLMGVFLLFCTFILQVMFDVRHDFLMSKSALSLFAGSEQGLFVGGEKSEYFELIRSHMSSLYNNFRSAFIVEGYLKYLPNFLMALIISTIFLITRFKVFSRQEMSFMTLITRLFFIIFLLSFIYPFPLRYWFLTGFQSFYLIFIGVILGKLFKFRIGKIAMIFLFLTFVFYSIKRIDTLYVHPPNDGGFAKIKGKLSAIDYLYKDTKGKRFGLLIFTPPVLADSYDYLLWWYGNKVYRYIPYQNKKDTFYLLIEPDSSKPWSYKGWLETVIKTGTILKTINLPSGIIIQKRSM